MRSLTQKQTDSLNIHTTGFYRKKKPCSIWLISKLQWTNSYGNLSKIFCLTDKHIIAFRYCCVKIHECWCVHETRLKSGLFMAVGVTQPIHANGRDDGAGSKTVKKKKKNLNFLIGSVKPRGAVFICLSLKCKTSCQIDMASIFRWLKLLFGIAGSWFLQLSQALHAVSQTSLPMDFIISRTHVHRVAALFLLSHHCTRKRVVKC